VLTVGPAAATTEVEDVDNEPPWGVLAACPVATTTEIEDIDGGPPGWCWQQVWQRPPPNLKTSMVGPLWGAGGMSSSDHHQS
jgi:hypothetical protein